MSLSCSWVRVGFGVRAYRHGGLRHIGVVGFSFGLLDFRVVGLFCGGYVFVLVVAVLEEEGEGCAGGGCWWWFFFPL